MNCYCCDRRIATARKVKLRPWRTYDPQAGGKDSTAYQFYCEEMTYRWAIICQACYSSLDNVGGLAEVGRGTFNIAGVSRRDRAVTLNEEQYRRFQEREAAKLGLDPDETG